MLSFSLDRLRPLVLTSASTVVLAYTVLRLLKLLSSRKNWFGGSIKKLENVGKRVETHTEMIGDDYPEYDIVIVGGGDRFIMYPPAQSANVLLCT